MAIYSSVRTTPDISHLPSRFCTRCHSSHAHASDVLEISLAQVYTQLATTETVQRELIEGKELKTLDIDSFREQHTGKHLLPLQLRYEWEPNFLEERNMWESRIGQMPQILKD